MSPPKTCAVCGDKALGYNFNAVTCESCKAFFRRNALTKKQFTCPFNQNCQITVVTRRFCQKCRLDKCLSIGMKSENIMSEEDKLIKRRKIEVNRAKRKQRDEQQQNDDMNNNSCDDTQSNASIESNNNNNSHSNNGNFLQTITNNRNASNIDLNSNSSATMPSPIRSCSRSSQSLNELNVELLSGSEIVEIIVNDPDRATQAISILMRSKEEALFALEKVLSSQVDALRLISHLIAYPGDALKIISKIMNSPFNALTVFTKFMSSPTDALEIISKAVDSPQDVVKFIRNLMDSPEDALDIMNKFMNTPAEALKMLNRILSSTHADKNETTTTSTTKLPIITQNLQIQQQKTNSNNNNNNSSLIQNILASPQGTITTIETSISPDLLVEQEKEIAHAQTVDVTHAQTNDVDFTTESADLRILMQQVFGDGVCDGNFNSLDTVLGEIIRMEYLSVHTSLLEPQLHIKKEQSNMYGACGATINNYNSNTCYQFPTHDALFQSPPPPTLGATHNFSNGCENYTNYTKQQIASPIIDIANERLLNEPEQMKLRELKIACEALYDPIEAEISVLDMGDERIKPQEMHHKFMSLINLTAVAIKRLIKMAKKISAFRNMCQEDQVALLKGGCTEMMIMRSVMTFDMNGNIWKVPHATEGISAIRADLLKIAKCNLYEELLKFNSTFDEKWRMDENIILILCAIVLFTPNRDRVVHKDVIKLEQNSYYYLLRRYLQTTYSGCEAKSTFMKLMQKVTDVSRLNEVIINVYLNVNPMQMEPLIREIFDIKPH